MRVLCINEAGWVEMKKFLFFWEREKDTDGPKYGEECTVIGEGDPDKYGEYYLLEGWSGPQEEAYLKNCFITLTGDKEEEEQVIVQELTATK